MRRARQISFALLLVVGATGAAPAQNIIRFGTGPFNPVTTLTMLVGATTSVQLISSSQCIKSYDVTIFYDAARLHVASADAIPGSALPAPTVTTGTDSAHLVAGPVATGPCAAQSLATINFAMSAGVTTGSFVSIRVNSALDNASVEQAGTAVAGYMDVCEGTQVWGDPDGSTAVNSRDALAALTAAVGLPTPGFDMSVADVDSDNQVTARDALYILSYGIGITAGGTRTGQVITLHCAPLAPAPTDMLFWNGSTLHRVLAGDTIPTSLGVVGNSSSPARFSPDGGKIVYVCNTINNDICTVDRDGGNQHDLLVGNGQDANHPVWSPDGLKIAFIDIFGPARSIISADSTGANPFTIYTNPSFPLLELGGWNTTSGLVYTRLSGPSRQLFKVPAAGPTGTEVFTNSSLSAPSEPSWSPAGDSVAFHNGFFPSGSIYVVGASGGTAKRRVQFINQGSAPSWTSAGIAFSSGAFVFSEAVLQAPSGRYLRLTRSSASVSYPTFR